jgi:hypothetical protein
MSSATERAYLDRYKHAANIQEKFWGLPGPATDDGKVNYWFWLIALAVAYLAGWATPIFMAEFKRHMDNQAYYMPPPAPLG